MEKLKINNLKELTEYMHKAELADLNEDFEDDHYQIEINDLELDRLYNHWLSTGEIPNENN